jgi:hypothetical protein
MRPVALALIAAVGFAAFVGSSRVTEAAARAAQCRPLASPAYAHRVADALHAGRDIWGERLLAAKDGPSFAAANRLLPPLLYAAGHGGTSLTASGVYYLPLTLPVSVGGPRGFGLHVADGSQIIVRRSGGPSLTVNVGPRGDERYGSCLARLQTPHLADGYLPILQVAYRDRAGVRYQEESFVGRLPRSSSLVSFIRVTADAGRSGRAVVMRLVSSNGPVIRRIVAPGQTVELDAAFAHNGARLQEIDADAYAVARLATAAFWERSLAGRPSFDVPEARVRNAARALQIEELEMTWRYSVGNTYEELSYAEALDVAQVMAGYGYGDVARQILRFTLRRLPVRFTNWRAGERLVAGAQYFALSRDVRYVTEETPALTSVVERIAREVAMSGSGLLPRERYSSDIADEIYSLQGQTLVWQGLLAMGRVWAATGHQALAQRCRVTATRLETGLRRAIHQSERRLADGSLFVPAALLDGAAPFQQLTASRDGTYWNLVVPYALASGFFPPHGAEATGLLRYLLNHGSRLLGLVRAGAYRLAGSDASVSGTDEVYGVNVARFLADADQPDQLALSLYGTLAAGLTPGTYVTGEAASVSPLGGAYYRTMYLPPNNDGAASFLEKLRLMLVHESRGPKGRARGLELAFATPRSWLRDGKSIVVRNAPTSFGPVSYSIARHQGVVNIVVDPPSSPTPATVKLRLRLPGQARIVRVEVAGTPARFDRRTGTIELSGRAGELEVVATIAG